MSAPQPAQPAPLPRDGDQRGDPEPADGRREPLELLLTVPAAVIPRRPLYGPGRPNAA